MKEDLIYKIIQRGRDLVAQHKCPGCEKDTSDAKFRDALSAKEFLITGTCQECQDKVFLEDEETET